MTEILQAPVLANHPGVDPGLLAPKSRASFMNQLHDKSVLVSPSSSIYPPGNIGLIAIDTDEYGRLVSTSVAAEIAFPDGSHACVLRRNIMGGSEPFFTIQGLDVDEQNGQAQVINGAAVDIPKGSDGATIGKAGTIGSSDIFGNIHSFDDTVSRNHMKIIDYGGGILSIADTSMNGSKIVAEELKQSLSVPQGEDVWDGYTSSAEELMVLRNEVERSLGRKERHTIGRESRIRDGVYEGKYGGEKIVVNYDDDPFLIDAAVEKVINKCTVGGVFQKGKVLNEVYGYVLHAMRYDLNAVQSIFDTVLGGKDGAKISLGVYIQEGVGVCRHQALFGGIILEQLVDRGFIHGSVSVRRNAIKGEGSDKYDGHAWIRYTNSAGKVYILDIAQNKLGELHVLQEKHEKNPTSTWNYST